MYAKERQMFLYSVLKVTDYWKKYLQISESSYKVSIADKKNKHRHFFLMNKKKWTLESLISERRRCTVSIRKLISQAKGQRMLYHPRWFIWTIWTVFSELLIFETVCYYFVSQLYNILHFLKEKGDLLLCGKRSILFWQQ